MLFNSVAILFLGILVFNQAKIANRMQDKINELELLVMDFMHKVKTMEFDSGCEDEE